MPQELREELVIRRSAAETVAAHTRAALPRECCGLLIGAAGRIERAVRARNLHPAADRYRIDPADHCAALRAARAAGMDVVGAYHSHPNGVLQPSAVDRREATYPDFVYLIAIPAADSRGALAAWRLAPDTCREIPLKVVV